MVTSRHTSELIYKRLGVLLHGGEGLRGGTERRSELAECAKLRGTAAGILRDFGVARRDRFPRERVGEFHAQILRRAVVCALGLAAHAAEKLFHRTIFQRVEADHAEHAAGSVTGWGHEFRKCGGQCPLDRAELIVHRDPDTLEGSRGRVNFRCVAITGRNGLCDQCRE